jgi:hypothetical protein
VKFIRYFLTCLAAVSLAGAILVAVAFIPAVQTWFAQMALARQPNLHASLGSLSAGFSETTATDLKLEVGGAVLTLPSIEARLPLTTVVCRQRFPVRSLVAKGWTLNLDCEPASDDAGSQTVRASGNGGGMQSPAQTGTLSAQMVAGALRQIIRGWKLPGDLSLDGIDLEGDVIVATPSEKTPTRVHVTIKGGGIAAGQEGVLTLDAAVADPEPGIPPNTVAHGRLVIAANSHGSLKHVGLRTSLSARDGSLPGDLTVSADAAVGADASQESYMIDLSSGNRHLATLAAGFTEGTRRFAGTWNVDLRDADIQPFCPNRSLPSLATNGDGQFDTDAAFKELHVVGHLNSDTSHLEVLAPFLNRIGAVKLDTHFDVVHSGQTIRCDHLSVSISGAGPLAVVQSLQSFSVDENTGDLQLADPGAGWMGVSIKGLPLVWLSSLADGFSFAGNDAIGEFVVRRADGRFDLRSLTPLTAAGVSVKRAGRILARGLDVSLSLIAAWNPKGWNVECTPFAVSNSGRRLATVEAKAASTPNSDEPVAVSGTWNADLDALASSPDALGIGWAKGLSASGDFSASMGSSAEIDAKLEAVGHDPARSITASLHVIDHADGSVAFLVPMKIGAGSNVSGVTADGTFVPSESGGRFYVDLVGETVALEHLRLIAAPFAGTGSLVASASPFAPAGDTRTSAGMRDPIPFWSNWVGRLKLGFDRLSADGREFTGVAGTVDVDHGSVRLQNGQGGLPPHRVVKLDGSISFDPAAESPYGLKATGSLSDIDATALFSAQQPGQEAMIEGHFSIADTFTGNGNNLDDLIGRAQEEFHLTSTAGIIRLLKTRISESIPEKPTPVADTLDNVGTAVRLVFGSNGNSLRSPENHLNKITDVVLDFTHQVSEIGYDQIAVTAVRGPDGTIHLVDISMTAPDEHLTGSGQIACLGGLSLSAQPLSLDLQFGARGRVAKLLTTAGLLTSKKDDLVYTMLNQSIHFGGTADHIDSSQWHDLLLKAATQTPPNDGKKGR